MHVTGDMERERERESKREIERQRESQDNPCSLSDLTMIANKH